ncbi:hypothetical protein K437DRAFT_296294 [Tilletiaria anomala UBC 951]|uniref:RPA43 OB domain-containing protein n=1 Tax=Tilletiaria anomala (strain ATCC 24038 / CBS 436.72 / UBC 951) TaxID=1037660 RepID=A0A066VIS4_TILAU|nr:uncharacterized protein K437DRAFT_296294 [Tilletiaria anomala UBC 951]KDN38634.1 hypothetical protein K437DRAFT_296294 [Tilletiaria anomala UBC 951]
MSQAPPADTWPSDFMPSVSSTSKRKRESQGEKGSSKVKKSRKSSGTDEAASPKKQRRQDKQRPEADSGSEGETSASEADVSKDLDGVPAVNGKKDKKHRKKHNAADVAGDTSIASSAADTTMDEASTSVLLVKRKVSKSDPPQSAYQRVYPLVYMPIPPVWANSPSRAVAELFDTMVMKYVAQLQGVLITHESDDKLFQSDSARVDADSPYAIVPVGVPCIIWSPRIGMRLEGKISLSSPSHVSLLLQGTFNASISAPHISLKHWEFVHEDPANSVPSSEAGSDGTNDHADGDADGHAPHSLGYWRNKKDGSRLGGTSGRLVFTVISMTVANHMLSLHGSLLKRPFSVPPPDEEAKRQLALVPGMGSGGLTMGPMGVLGAAGGANGAAGGANGAAGGLGGKRVRWHDEAQAEDNDDLEGGKGGELEEDETGVAEVPPRVLAPKVSKAARGRNIGAAAPPQGKKITF